MDNKVRSRFQSTRVIVTLLSDIHNCIQMSIQSIHNCIQMSIQSYSQLNCKKKQQNNKTRVAPIWGVEMSWQTF